MDTIFHCAKNKRSESAPNSGAVSPAPPLGSGRRALRTSSAVSAGSSTVSDMSAAMTPRTLSALPHAAQAIKARRIRLYRNGDAFYDGMVVVLAPDNFRTFDSLLSYINKSQLADPSVLKKVSIVSPVITWLPV